MSSPLPAASPAPPADEAEALETRRVQAARLWIASQRAYFSSLLFSCNVVASDHVPIAAIDEHLRIYLNPAYINAADIDLVVSTLVHEISHPLLRHAERARVKGLSDEERFLWNLAGDLCINQEMANDGLRLDPQLMLPSMLGLPPGLTTDEYFRLLCDNLEMVETAGRRAGGDGEQSHGQQGPEEQSPTMPNCGSGAHARHQPWEHGAPSDASPGLDEAGQEMVLRKVATDIVEHAKAHGRGSVPAGLLRAANEFLTPQVPWQRELAGLLRHAVQQARGYHYQDRSRPSRRDDPDRAVVLPSWRSPVPEIAAVIDTSGSMSPDDLAYALTELRGVLKHVAANGAGVKVLAVDAAVHTTQKVFSVAQVTLAGGGGTNMGVGIAAAGKASGVVVFTDGETPYPDKPPRGVGRVIIGLIAPEYRLDSLAAQVPSWMRVVRIPTRTT